MGTLQVRTPAFQLQQFLHFVLVATSHYVHVQVDVDLVF